MSSYTGGRESLPAAKNMIPLKNRVRYKACLKTDSFPHANVLIPTAREACIIPRS
jgi:hypothetical protein